MDYPTRKRKRSNETPRDRDDDRLVLRPAEYSAPFGDEGPWRIVTTEAALERWTQTLRPERGRLH